MFILKSKHFLSLLCLTLAIVSVQVITRSGGIEETRESVVDIQIYDVTIEEAVK